MSATLYTVRCGRCQSSRLISGTLEFARMAVCDACTTRMTVVGHEEPPPTDLPAVEKPPGIESCNLTAGTNDRARRIFDLAFAKE